MYEKISRINMLFVFYLKRDYKKLVIWILGLGMFSGGFVPAFKEIGKGQGLVGMFETLQNPAMISMVGPTPVKTATDYTLGAMYSHEMLLFCSLFAIIVSLLHVVSHTRKEEDLGLTELVRSFQVGRQANSLATIVETFFINALLAIFIALLMISFGAETITVEGSFLFGATIGMAGVIGAVIALLMAQIMPTSSAATGSSLAVIGLLYIVRGATDISNINLTMFNPLGWTYLTYPFTENNWLPLIFAFVFSMIVVIISFGLEGARDMGASYLPQKDGRGKAKKSLLSIHGLFIKINKGIMISWLIAFVILGAAYGSIYGDMQTFLESNELMKQMFTHSNISIEESFTATIMMVMISLVAILPIAVVNKLFTVENRSHLSQIFATKVTRSQLYWTTISLAIFVGTVGVLLASGGLGATAVAVMDESTTMNVFDFFVVGYNLFPSVLFFTSLAAFALGWVPTLGKFVYIYLTFSFLLNYFGDILDLPEWFLKTAIQSWIPQMPMDDFSGYVFMTITVISAVLMALGYFGYNRRDLREGV